MGASNLDEYINRRTTAFIVSTQVLQLLATVVSAWLSLGWKSAAAISFALSALYIGYALATGNRLLQRLVLFSLIAGFLELFADHYSISVTGTLVYPPELLIWTSPLYMPFAWVAVFSQLAYYGLLLTRWKGLMVASLLIALLGGVYIPIYEHLAADARWWYYQHTPMLFNAPYFVILAEAMLSLSVPVLVVYLVRGTFWRTVLAAIVLGIVIYASELIAYKLVTALV
jgi:hypothetical protein